MKNILYLYRELMPYNIPVLQELVAAGYNLYVVHESLRKLTPYTPPVIPGVNYFKKEAFSQGALHQLAINIKPSAVFVCDRTNVIYNKTAMLLRRKFNTPVICGCDTQWAGGKQWLNVITSGFRHQKYYSHMLVAGVRQFEYAKRLGFRNSKIIWPLYSADTAKFNKSKMEECRFHGKRNILFVGRFAEVKGLQFLLAAWETIPDKRNAILNLVGNGPLKEKLIYPKDVKIHDFMSQDDLMEIASNASCLVLPSVFEPWAVVIHEFAAVGLPLIVTSSCGASAHFVLHNYNGYIVEPGNIDELRQALVNIIEADDNRLFVFGKRSRELSQTITPERVAASILSVIKE